MKQDAKGMLLYIIVLSQSKFSVENLWLPSLDTFTLVLAVFPMNSLYHNSHLYLARTSDTGTPLFSPSRRETISQHTRSKGCAHIQQS